MRSYPHRAAAAAVVAACLVLTGCGDSDDKPDSGTDGAGQGSDALPSDDELTAYFSAIASRDADQLEAAVSLAEPGSIAHTYAGYSLAVAHASLDGGAPAPSGELAEIDDGYRGCEQVDGGESCVTWSDLEGADGKLVSFTIDGESLDERLTSGTGETVESGGLVSAELLYAYRSVQSEDLFILAEVHSDAEAVSIAGSEATYLDETGQEVSAERTFGAVQLPADSDATVAVVFDGAAPGGVLTVPVYSEDFATEELLEIETHAIS